MGWGRVWRAQHMVLTIITAVHYMYRQGKAVLAAPGRVRPTDRLTGNCRLRATTGGSDSFYQSSKLAGKKTQTDIVMQLSSQHRRIPYQPYRLYAVTSTQYRHQCRSYPQQYALSQTPDSFTALSAVFTVP